MARSTRSRTHRAVALALASLSSATALSAQASYFEGFNGVEAADLEAEGWSFRNQSEPEGVLGWRTADTTTAYEGTHYLVTDGYCVAGGGVGSNWAVLPAIPGQQAGDELVLYLAEGWTSLASQVLEVRYSPSGGTDTGSSATDLGDFDVLLASFEHDTIGWWAPHSLALPGAGRLALRSKVPNGYAAGTYVDALSIGTPPAGGVPIPGVGETALWTSAMSPIELPAGTTHIVAGASVVVEPGVTVVLETGDTLSVEGALTFEAGSALEAAPGAKVLANQGGLLEFQGTAQAPIAISADSGFQTSGVRAWGSSTLILRHVQADAHVWVASGSNAVLEHSSFVTASPGVFQSSGLRTFNGSVAVRDCSFTDGWIVEEGGYLLLDDSSFVNTRVTLYRDDAPQTLYLDGLTAVDVADGAPFEVHNFDVFFGPNNLIQNNLYPVRLETGGIATGSTLPSSGNVHNIVSGVARMGRRATWSRNELPYVLDWDNNIMPLSGTLTVEPGVTARFRRGQNTVSDTFPIAALARFVARGTADQPIVFTDDGSGWGGLFFGDNSNKRPKLEHVVVENADLGVIAKACTVRIVDSLLRNNLVGAQSNSAGKVHARGTRFLGNGTGVETSPGAGGSSISAGRADLNGLEDPNSFAGNGIGFDIQNLQVTSDARGNWWGAASGPDHPQNPGGSGDSADVNASVLPFLGEEPALDAAPRVTLARLADVLEEGTPLILRWDVEDEGTIVSQRIDFSPHGDNPALAPWIVDVPPDVRTLQVTVPAHVPSSNNALPVLRVVAIDDQGQEGWDEAQFFTPHEPHVPHDVMDLPAVVRPGEQHDVCWELNYADAYLQLDDIDWAISLGGTTTNCLSLGVTIPGVSTDLARIVVIQPDTGYSYSEYFSIRPDPLLGDAPPTVDLVQPVATSYRVGTAVPIRWLATDDEGLRSFDIQASYDGGRAWNALVEGLAGDASEWTWDLPEGDPLSGVLVRVVATDLRFQTSSATTEFDIVPVPPRRKAIVHQGAPTTHP